jgi:hypothetical protein
MATKQKFVVVGAGPVGALAAIYAAQRGHEVEIYELRGGTRCLSYFEIYIYITIYSFRILIFWILLSDSSFGLLELGACVFTVASSKEISAHYYFLCEIRNLPFTDDLLCYIFTALLTFFGCSSVFTLCSEI